MTDPNLTAISMHPLSGAGGIRSVSATRMPDATKCELALHIGVFFDGTGNNRYEHEPIRKQSNVARLFRAYPDDRPSGYFPIYVPGIGTAFPEIGEIEPAFLGSPFGAGGDGRINFGLLQLINAIHRAASANGQLYARNESILALCRNTGRTAVRTRDGVQYSQLEYPSDEAALRAVGMETKGGLLLDKYGDAPQRTAFFKRATREIAQKLAAQKKPRIIEILIDVFGFSRGAAQARTFCNWLLECFDGATLCGVPARIRFLGLFDSVASVGLPTSSGVGTDGHASWADAPHLRIPPQVYNCVHFVAMHENRGSFPVELVRNNGVLPANCQEWMFPGMHSDVGGGYAPNEQGRGPNGLDEEKLSLLPLNAMYDAARAARVPVNKVLAVDENGRDPFKVAENVRAAAQAFLSNRQSPRLVRDWLVEYLTWRYQARDRYMSLPWQRRAAGNGGDRQALGDLRGANDKLLSDTRVLTELANGTVPPRVRSHYEARVGDMAKEAPAIFKHVRTATAVDAAAATLFSEYVHDSYAGFRPFDNLTVFGWDPVPGSWETEGYFRWRRRYEGSDVRYTRNEQAPADEPTATQRTEAALAHRSNVS